MDFLNIEFSYQDIRDDIDTAKLSIAKKIRFHKQIDFIEFSCIHFVSNAVVE